MNETHQVLSNLQRRYQMYSQHQFTFVAALDRCRKIAFEANIKISTIAQIQHYYDHMTDNATDKRMIGMFLDLVRDLREFRRTLKKISKRKDEELFNIFEYWKKLVEPRVDISDLRVKYPYQQLNHLSCDESRNHFGGVISLLPIAIDCAKRAVDHIEAVKAYRHLRHFEGGHGDCDRPFSAMIPGHKRELPHEKDDITVSPPSISTMAVSGGMSKSTSSLRSSLSEVSLATAKNKTRQNSSRPATAASTYGRQARITLDEKNKIINGRPSTGKCTQTKNYLGCTVKPALDWPHKTLTNADMRRMLKQNRHLNWRPNWKP